MWKDADKPDQSQTLLVDIPDVASSNITDQEKEDLIALPNIIEKEIHQMNSYFQPYIFYRKISKTKTECFCTSCNRSYTADSTFYHKTPEICPHCRTTATAISAGYPQMDKTETINFVLFKKHKTKDIVYAICLNAGKRYNGDYSYWFNKKRFYGKDFCRQPDLECDLIKIYVFKQNECKVFRRQYAYRNGKYYCIYTKIKKKIPQVFSSTMYKPADKVIIGKEILLKTHLKYYARALPSEYRCHLVEWLNFCSVYPIAEIAAKSKSLTVQTIVKDKLFYDISHRDIANWGAKKPKDFLKISLNELKDYDEKNYWRIYSLQPLEIYARHKKKGERLSFDICQFEYSLINQSYKAKDAISHIDIKKLYHYRKRQMASGTWRGERLYLDYLEHARMCGYDLNLSSILYPRNIQQAHDDAVANWQIIKAEEKKKEAEREAMQYDYPKRFKKLCKAYSFEHGDLTVVIPTSASEIIEEGRALQHCVGEYASRHIKGETTILFLRHIEAPNKPYYTIEIVEKLKSIKQCHGFKNEYYNPKAEEVKAFEKEFSEFLKNPKKYKSERTDKECRKSA